MSLLKRSTSIILLLIALCANSVLSHTYLSAVYLDNSLLNEGDCVRPHPSTAFDSPIPLVTSADMTCGWLPKANEATNRKCPISAGSTIGIQWHHNSNSPSDDIIEATHKGPVIVYLAKSDTGAGDVWFKIYEDGLVNGRWGVDRLLDRRGRVDVTIPADIAPGNYLLRGEIIALHGAYDINGVQPYVGCVELTISGNGNANPSGVSLPGYYKNTDPGMLLSIYQGITNYIIPGPAIYTSGSSPSPSTSAPTTTPTSAPTSSPPSSAPTTRPTYTPTAAPPTAAPTTRPTTTPTSSPPSSSGESVKVQVNTGSNTWWFSFAATGGSEETIKAELMDSGVVPSFHIMTRASYGFYFSQSVQVTLPISLRLTSSSGKQVVLVNFITSLNDFAVKDTAQDYATSVTPAPATQAPVTQAPTYTPTSSPATPSPSNGETVKVKLHSDVSEWWVALAVTGIDSSKVAKVELKDSNTVTQFKALQATEWGYYIFETTGAALVAPITVQITSTEGKIISSVFPRISGNLISDSF